MSLRWRFFVPPRNRITNALPSCPKYLIAWAEIDSIPEYTIADVFNVRHVSLFESVQGGSHLGCRLRVETRKRFAERRRDIPLRILDHSASGITYSNI
jgi:hypothetical protein